MTGFFDLFFILFHAGIPTINKTLQNNYRKENSIDTHFSEWYH